ncbi:hypothetical protein FNV43_RR21710 [Rhamnella rubrinervis]|uniref:Uncharacterized protein n=1 Tax=Rhamnella rubrinervis TaxID=2594499 RepID=A0A8K0DVM9_9ROSA|nr:hypothetical protein FNV43_RR21710 [Rhamnella rubrinervis]
MVRTGRPRLQGYLASRPAPQQEPMEAYFSSSSPVVSLTSGLRLGLGSPALDPVPLAIRDLPYPEMREEIRGEGMTGQLDECISSSLKLTYSILDMDKTTAEARENECLSKLNRLEKQVQTVQKEKTTLIADHEEQTQELEKKLEATQREVRVLKTNYENQLIIGFKLMKAALKTVELNFVLERLDEVQLGEDIVRREGNFKTSLPTTTSTGGEAAHVEASANAPDVEEERQEEG